jgi:ubiquinone/menaquinone biosynthesis C-methylase UbiE
MNSYKTLCTEFYDLDKPSVPADALAFYLRYVEKANGPILEPMCGTGRFLVPLLEMGFDADGIDGSPQMLAACRAKCHTRSLSPRLYEQLLHEINMARQYALVFIPAGSFCLVTEIDHVRESLKRIHALMLPGAKFVFEIEQHKPKESSSWPWGGRWIQRPDGAKIVISWLGHYDAATSVSRNIHRYELIKDGQLLETEFEEFDMRHYERAEICELLEAAGFKEIKTFKIYEQRPPEEKDEEIVVECSKH